jgi:hypothetical protein
LENEITHNPSATQSIATSQAAVTSAVAWFFTQQMLPEIVIAKDYPSLRTLSSRAEALPTFLKYPHEGPGVSIKK